jgi:hypothetical protein
MPSRRTLLAALAALSASCAIANRITGGFGRVDGCMYYRGDTVPMTCAQRIAAAGGIYTFSELASCIDERFGHGDSFGTPADTTFIGDDGGEVQLKSCFFEGKTRKYYRYEEAREGRGAALYIRTLSCGDGCRDEKSLYSLEISSSGIVSKKLR